MGSSSSERNQTLHLWALLTDMGTANDPQLSSTNRSDPNILAQLSAEKQMVGGACITLAPHY
jgi:hypothetical protein